MNIYKNVFWHMKNEDISLKKIFWKQKYAILKQRNSYENSKDITLTLQDVVVDSDQFCSFIALYTSFIESKENPHVYNIAKKIKFWQKKWRTYTLLWLWKWDKLVWWAVCKMHTWNFQLGYRAYDTTIRIKNLSLWYILEYEYFLYGLSHDVQVFSRWKSANIAWYLGTALVYDCIRCHYDFYLSFIRLKTPKLNLMKPQ